MQGLVDYQAILEMVFSSTLQKVKGKDGGVNWDDYADMYNEMTGMETASTLNLLSNLCLNINFFIKFISLIYLFFTL